MELEQPQSRIEKFLYAICALDIDDLPTPMSRIEILWNCLITGEMPSDYRPLSRNEEYLMYILGIYDNLPTPQSRGEVLLYKLATGDNDLSNIEPLQSRYEKLLAYIIENGGISGDIDFEYVEVILTESFTTLYNTKEKPIKSAILKGRTLVNCIVDSSRNGYSALAPSITIEDEGWLTAVASSSNSHFELPMDNLNIKPSTKYLLVIECESNSYQESNILHHNLNMANTYEAEVDSPWVENLQIKILPVGISTYILTTKSDFSILNNPVGCRSYVGVGTGTTKFRYMVIEYQDGMENWDIPYFEGIQSVKMPVLTTVGKNLFDVNKFESIGIDEHGYYVPTKFVDSIAYVTLKLKPNTRYTVTGEYISDGNASFVYRIENNGTYRKLNTDFDTDATGVVNIKIGSNNYNVSDASKVEKIMIVESTLNNIYEPFKSNILTVNEPVELRRIGEVRDTLDLMTGEVVERISSFKPTNAWSISNELENTVLFTIKPPHDMDLSSTIISDKLPSVSPDGGGIWNRDIEGIGFITRGDLISVRLLKTKASTLQEFQNYLQSKPITIQYKLATESIKTVDLSVVDQDGEKAKLSSFDDITCVTVTSDGILPDVKLEVATKNEEVLNTMSLKMDDIYATQTTLEETSNAQSENVDATMMATTEIYEGLL